MGRLDIAPEELEGRSQRSALFKTMFLAFQQASARDWQTQVAIALSHVGSAHQLQFHHIFPKALLKKNGYGTREIDDIANLAFIGGRANRRISDKPPATYIPDLIATNGDQPFTSQCIPTDPALLAPSTTENSWLSGGGRLPSGSTPLWVALGIAPDFHPRSAWIPTSFSSSRQPSP